MLAGRIAVAVLAALAAARADAAVVLRVDTVATPPDAPGVEITASNAGDEAAVGVTPVVVSQHVTAAGDGARLDPGARRVWRLSLPPPPARAAVPAIGQVRWAGAREGRGSVPVVAVLRAADAPAPSVDATLVATPLARVASMRFALVNRGDTLLAGRVVAVLPAAITTEPQSQAATLAAHASTTVPIMLDASEARVGVDYPAFAFFEYADGGAPQVVVATTTLRASSERGSRVPLLVGGGALVGALGVLAFALRRSRRPG